MIKGGAPGERQLFLVIVKEASLSDQKTISLQNTSAPTAKYLVNSKADFRDLIFSVSRDLHPVVCVLSILVCSEDSSIFNSAIIILLFCFSLLRAQKHLAKEELLPVGFLYLYILKPKLILNHHCHDSAN